MLWKTPSFCEVKMDAEIGSYNEDRELPERDRFARAIPRSRQRARAPSSAVRVALAALAPLAGLLAATAARPSAAAPLSVTTRSYDNGRSGANTSETTLTVANINTGSFAKLFTLPVDDEIYAEPLYVPNAFGTPNNVVYVATISNSVYAFDADRGFLYWHKTYGTPITHANLPGGSCGNYPGSNIGLVGTPVVTSQNVLNGALTLFFVTRSLKSGCSGTSCAVYQLHAVDVTTGNEKTGSPVTISASFPINASTQNLTFNPNYENQRAALLATNGNIVIAFGSYCDHNAYDGWLLEYDASTLAQKGVFATNSNNGAGAQAEWGAIWQGGGGPAADAAGNIYVSAGNDVPYDSSKFSQLPSQGDYGESIIEFAPTPKTGTSFWYPTAFYRPPNALTLSNNDQDLGASGPLITNLGTPGATQTLLQIGKDGTLYNINRTNNPPDLNRLVQNPFLAIGVPGANGGESAYNGGVFWNGSYYIWQSSDKLRGFTAAQSTGVLGTTPFAQGSIVANTNQPCGALSVSANGTSNGIVWATNQTPSTGGSGNSSEVPGTLYAFDAVKLGAPLWTSDMVSSDAVGNLAKWTPPLVDNGKVYASSFSKSVSVYGEIQAGPPGAVYQAFLNRLVTFYVRGNHLDDIWATAPNTTPSGSDNQGTPTNVQLVGTPSGVYRSAANEMTAFVVGADGNLYKRYYNNSIGYTWDTTLPGNPGEPIGSNPSALYDPSSDTVQVFVIDKDGNLHDTWFSTALNKWMPWEGPPAFTNGVRLASDPSALMEDDTVEAFAIGTDGNLYWASFTVSGWTLQSLGAPAGSGGLTRSPSAVYDVFNSHTYIFALGKDGNLYDISHNPDGATGWSAWESQGDYLGFQQLGSSPSTCYTASLQRVSVFILGTDGNLYDKYSTSTGWTWDPIVPKNPGVSLASAPSVIQTSGANSVSAFVNGTDGNRYEAFYNGSGWSWVSFGGGI